MMLLVIWAFIFMHFGAGFEITRDDLPEWLTSRSIKELRKSYHNLDYNNDGFVSFGEMKLGIVSLCDNQVVANRFERDMEHVENSHEISMHDDYFLLESTQTQFKSWFSYKPESFSCVPSLDPVDFVDCMVISSRQVSDSTLHGMTDSSIILFETALSMYLGHECSDISPKADTSCRELIQTDTFTACRDANNYCTLSCYQCKIESNIFGHNIRGLNKKAKIHSATKVYEIENLKKHKKMLTKTHNVKTSSKTMRRLMEESSKKVFHNLGPKKSTSGSSSTSSSTSSCTIGKKELHSNSDRFFFISDAHIEPWYDVSGSGEISRFNDVACTVSNMFECHDTTKAGLIETETTVVDCSLNGESDPPINMYATAMTAANHRSTRIENSVLFFVGDLQAHDYTEGVSSPLVQTVNALQSRMLSMTTPFFTSDQIFIAPGNNDGPHNSIFVYDDENGENAEVSAAWGEYFVNEGVVNNDLKRKYTIDGTTIDDMSQTDLFKIMGYYIKQLPEHGEDLKNTYVIVINTNLGSSNYIQNEILKSDLDWISQTKNGKAIILAHHPNVITSMIDQEYLDDGFIIGIFSGHVHYFSETDENGFTILPALSQYAYVNAIATSDLDSETKKLTLDESDLLVYHGYEGEAANYACWTHLESETKTEESENDNENEENENENENEDENVIELESSEQRSPNE